MAGCALLLSAGFSLRTGMGWDGNPKQKQTRVLVPVAALASLQAAYFLPGRVKPITWPPLLSSSS